MTRRNVLPAWKHLLAIAAAVLTGTLAYAQAPQPAPDDPPVRVGRLSNLSGEVSFSPAGNDEWVQARVNRPVITGDQLWADNDGRAELTLDDSTWWLGQNTSVTVSNLDDRIAQFQVQQGTIDFRVRRISSGNIVEVDTPNLAFTVTRPGQYRIVVDPQDGATTVMVRSGGGDVYGENASYAVASGQAYRFYGNDLRDSELVSNTPPDALDRWVEERDRRYDAGVSVRYVSPEVVGYEDLDTYGTWNVQASYGSVWFPRSVASGWAPYRDGHWAWIDPWGWTWVDDQPWGFAPFHYGRWAYFDRGWGWVPGPRNVRPVYAPALVAFVGGSGFSLSVSSGPAIGWFPLGPREVYRPPYRVSRDYFRRVNVSNTVVTQTNITNIYNNYQSNTNVTQVNYVNMRVPNAVTAVPPAAFAQSQNVGRAAVALPASTIARAEVQQVARVAPARPALVGAAPVARAKPPAAAAQRTVVARAAPPPPPVPDAQKLQALERNPGQPLSRRELQQMRQTVQAAPARTVRVTEQAKPAANAAPPARPAGEGASRRAQGAAGASPGGTSAPPGSPAAPPAVPGRAVTPPVAGTPPGPPAGRGPGAARGQAAESKGGPPTARGPEAKGPPAAAVEEGKAPERGPEAKGPPVARPPGTAAPGSAAQRESRRGPPDNAGAPSGPASRAVAPDGNRAAPEAPPVAQPPVTRSPPQGREERVPQARPETRPEAAPPAAARPPESARQNARQMQQERALERSGPPQSQPPQSQRPPEPRAAPQPPQSQRPPEPRAAPQPPQARPQPQSPPEARPQAQPPPEARPQPQPRAPEARPQPQPRAPEARPQPQPSPPEAQRGPQRGQPERPQPREDRGKGNDKDKDKDKDKN